VTVILCAYSIQRGPTVDLFIITSWDRRGILLLERTSGYRSSNGVERSVIQRLVLAQFVSLWGVGLPTAQPSSKKVEPANSRTSKSNLPTRDCFSMRTPTKGFGFLLIHISPSCTLHRYSVVVGPSSSSRRYLAVLIASSGPRKSPRITFI